ncbi:MAG: phenyltransferase domain-containing protein [Thermodesulfobacteriota bacterium]|nr:phenyltransferase domain-containing protein [Thermodesulfobacteriota bacterium]
MEYLNLKNKQALSIDIEPIVTLIAGTQRESGEIPWSEGDKTDPWDHVEAAMGLCVGGRVREARRAFEWLARMQLEDGSWYASYRLGLPEDKTREANMSSYIAVGVLHHYLVTGDTAWLKEMWKTVRAALDFSLGLQAPGGEIHWAISPQGQVDPMALLTGSSSVYMSVKCGLSIARLLGHGMPAWAEALKKLGRAIKNRPHLFNMAKARYSMDWFYPILCGAVGGSDAQKRLDRYWAKYVVEGHGVLCVSDRPWVTIAETSELVLTLSALGGQDQAETVFSWIQDKRYQDGSCWCGYTYPDMVIWPEEKVTWTNAVFLLAADALYGITPAGRLFSHRSWSPAGVCLLV